MSLADYQQQVDDLVQPYATPYWSALSQFAHMAEELGEIGRVLNHKYGDKLKKSTEEPDDLTGELGDLLFGIICLANSEGVNLDEAFAHFMHKMETRDKDRFAKKGE